MVGPITSYGLISFTMVYQAPFIGENA